MKRTIAGVGALMAALLMMSQSARAHECTMSLGSSWCRSALAFFASYFSLLVTPSENSAGVAIDTTYYADSAIGSDSNNGTSPFTPWRTGTDTTPPTAPTNLKASVISSSQINLTWTASTDNVGVTNYKVFRNNVQVGQNLNPSFNNTGLTANTTYTYYVIAYDAAGNSSPKSASVSATTAGSVTITVSNVAVSNVATSSATIAFTTNVAASTDILYGTNGSYNNSDPADAASLNHTHVLTSLTPGTVYNFKISALASGVRIYTGSYSFTTLSVSPPSIGAYEPGSLPGIRVSWPPPLPSGLTQYYVSPNGSDANSGSQSSPWLTINHAAWAIPSGAGAIIHVAPGNYNLTSATCIVVPRRAVSASAPVVFLSDTQWGAKVNGGGNCLLVWDVSGSYVDVYGFDITGTVTGGTGSTGAAINATGQYGNYDIAYNRIHDLAPGIGAAVDIGPSNGGTYTGAGGCNFHDNTMFNLAYDSRHSFGDYALYYSCGGGNVYNNLMYRLGSIGLHAWHWSTNLHAYNNTVYDAYIGMSFGDGGLGGVTNAYFDGTNNIVADCYFGIQIVVDYPTSTISTASVFRNNNVFDNTSNWYYNKNGLNSTFQAEGIEVTGTVTSDPQFVSTGTGNYVIKSTSPDVRAGLFVNPYTPTKDLAGNTRP